jgi:serine protease
MIISKLYKPLIRCKLRIAILCGVILAFSSCGGGGSSNNAPNANITVSTENGYAPLTVNFNASGSSDSDGSISSYAWNFGDDSAGTGLTIKHTYKSAGTYLAKLTVTDNDDSTDTATTQIVVEASPPDARFTVSTDQGAAPLTVRFDATLSKDNDGSISLYAWNFGDGSTGTGSTVQHAFQNAGSFTARLTVTDNDGLTDSAYHQISVSSGSPTHTYTISGTVTSSGQMIVDSDVNDPNASYTSNNSFATAQKITAPVTVSGFVNADNTGTIGDRFAQKGDYDDYYQVSLTKGMSISLYMSEDSTNSELNLYLYNSTKTLVANGYTSTDKNGVASLTVSVDDTYFIRVEAADYDQIRTFTLYALTIGLVSAAVTEHPLRLEDNFVPGEILVRFETKSSDIVSLSGSESKAVSALGFSTKAGNSNRDKLLKQKAGTDKDTFFENLGIRSAIKRSMGTGNMGVKTREKMETLWMVRALRKNSKVRCAVPNYIRKQLLSPNDGYYSYQWHYPLINLPEAWDITTGSSEVIVAVVDTGVLLNHPDLQGQLVDGYDFISDTEISLDGDGIDSNPDDPGDKDNVDGSSSFHGTHVAGTIAATSNNDKGVAGIAWNTKIMPLRALGYGGGTSYDIMEAVKYAAGLDNDSNTIPDNHADVINLSLGGGGASSYEEEIYTEARQNGVIVIAAAGNDGSTEKSYPAAYEDVVSVSAVTTDKTLASYSNYGSTIDLAAPGGDSTDTNQDGYIDGVLSTCGDDSSGDIEMIYAFATGTSMAAPHVSGVVALMKALYPGLTPDEFDSLLTGGYLTQDIGTSGRDNSFGYGLIDAYKAVIIARESGNTGSIPAILTVSSNIVNLGSATTTADIVLKNGGGNSGSLKVTGYSSDTAWLSVTPGTDIDDNGLGTYSVTVNRSSLSDGTYSGTLTFESNENNLTVTVYMSVGTATQSTNGGYLYILLLDPESYDTIDQASSAGENGSYDFIFPGLSYGESYIIYAGTDSDNDGYICDDGEACGAYISLDEPIKILLTHDLEGINFYTDININFPNTSTGLFTRNVFPLKLKNRKEVVK